MLAAFLTSTFRAADWLLSPAIRVVLATPVASFIILSLLWIGHTRVPAFISMLIVIPIVWANLYWRCARRTVTCSRWRACSA